MPHAIPNFRICSVNQISNRKGMGLILSRDAGHSLTKLLKYYPKE